MGVITHTDHPELVYVPFSKGLLNRTWSQPLQLRWADDYETIEVRDMREPVMGVFITADSQLEMPAPPPRDSGKPDAPPANPSWRSR